MTPHSAGFCVFADTYPDLAGFVVLVTRTIISLPHVLPPTFLLQPGFKLHKEMGANWRWVDCVARTELEPGCFGHRAQPGFRSFAKLGPGCLFLGLLSIQHFQPHELSKPPTLQINYFPAIHFQYILPSFRITYFRNFSTFKLRVNKCFLSQIPAFFIHPSSQPPIRESLLFQFDK